MADKVQQRRDIEANWVSTNPILSIGELGIALDVVNFKVGDGVTDWNTLPYYIPTTVEAVQDAIGAALTDTSSIDLTYDDANNQIRAIVLPAGVDHNLLLNYSANRHIDHTSVSITGTDGLAGGGDISSSRTINLPAVGTAGTYGSASSVPVFTTDAKGRVSAVTPTNISIASSAITDWTEAVQDVMGSILVDTDTIDFTYNDAANSLIVDVKKQMSITSDSSGLKLVSDKTSPGNLYYYGTDSGGTKGWYSLTTVDNDQLYGANTGGFVSGRYYDNSTSSRLNNNLSSAANLLTLVPFIAWKDLTINQIGTNIFTAKNAYMQFLIYSTGTDGWPASRLYQSANVLSTPNGFAGVALSFTFSANIVYWLGVHTASNPAYSAISKDDVNPLCLMGPTATTYATVLQTTITYGTAPATWTFAEEQLTSSDVPSIRMRAA